MILQLSLDTSKEPYTESFFFLTWIYLLEARFKPHGQKVQIPFVKKSLLKLKQSQNEIW